MTAGALPDGTRLMHIGPFKTGTTTIQAAFDQNRESLLAQGVDYVSRNAHPMVAVMAGASGVSLPNADPALGPRRWAELLSDLRASQARVAVVSSEFFSDAKADRIPQLLDEFDLQRTHVVVTLRPLVRILASQWQQYMQNRPVMTYDDSLDYAGWLHAILDDPEQTRVTPSFWQRHGHDRLVARWLELVGPDRLTVIAVDESDKRMLLRSFEELVGVRGGTLVPHSVGANRSLTVPEIQVLRAFNEDWMARGWSGADYTKLVRFGAVRHLQEREPLEGEARLLTPAWAVERTAELSARIVGSLRASGVRVIGDLDSLADPSVAVDVGENPPHVDVPDEIPARLMAGLVKAMAELPSSLPQPGSKAGDIEVRLRADKAARRALRQLPGMTEQLARVEAELGAQRTVDDLGAGAMAGVAARRVRDRLRSWRK